MAKFFNLAVIHTPFQALALSRIREQYPDYFVGTNWLIWDMSCWNADVLNPSYWDEVVYIDPPTGKRTFPERQRVAHSLVDRIERYARDYQQVRLWVANLDWSTSNVLYGRLRKTNLALYSLPEGIASIVPVRWTPVKLARLCVKLAWGTVLGRPFYPIGADIAGLMRADRVFSFVPEMLPHDVRSRAIAVSFNWDVQKAGARRAVLVLGQSLDKHLPPKRHLHLIERLVTYAKSLEDAEETYYKPHHEEAEWVQDIFREAGFVIVSDPTPAELLLSKLPVRYLVSVGSSALLHAKLLMGDSVHAIAVGISEVKWVPGNSRKRLRELLALYRAYGVKIEE